MSDYRTIQNTGCPKSNRETTEVDLVSCPSNTLTIVASATALISRSDDESMLPHRRGGATKKPAPSRRNPPGRWGLRGHLVVARRRRCHHIDSSSLLDLVSQAPSAIVNVLERQDTSVRSATGSPGLARFPVPTVRLRWRRPPTPVLSSAEIGRASCRERV